ncbi:MAG: HEAT repeat domain-containing protein, partial [Thermoanaerobaculaceae bacterium]|nr:HEAT repeat domain-containing protein [Thermoanaerobaculaceae bacterium]
MEANQDLVPNVDESLKLLQNLPTMELCERKKVILRLAKNPSPFVRQRALNIGSVLLSDEELVDFLRNESDDVVRNTGLEIFKIKGQRCFSLMVSLLKEEDKDVALQALLILDSMSTPRAVEPILELIRKTDDLNLLQAAIIAIGRIGDERVIPELVKFLYSEPWLQIAAISALGEIRSAKAVPYLRQFLNSSPLNSIAMEALARIGGEDVYQCLEKNWISKRDSTDNEIMLELLVYVAEGLEEVNSAIPEMAKKLLVLFEDEDSKICSLSARLAIALNFETLFSKAIKILERSENLPERMPICYLKRKNFLKGFLSSKEPLFSWGI